MTQEVGSQLIHDPKFVKWWNKYGQHHHREEIKEQLAEAFSAGMREKEKFRLKLRDIIEEVVKDEAFEIAYKAVNKLDGQ